MMIDFLFSFLASLGFAIIFNIKGKNALMAAFGGAIAWCTFVALAFVIEEEIVRYFLASVVISIYAREMAKIRKCPVLVFLVIAFIPLVPGYSIYKTMEYLLLSNIEEFIITATKTFKIVMAITTGFLVTTKFNINGIVIGETKKEK